MIAEDSNILSDFLVPIFVVMLSSIIPIIITKHTRMRDKNQYIKFLRTNFSIIETYFYAIQTYKATILATIPMYFLVGVLIGFIFEMIIKTPLIYFVLYVLKIDYIEKLFPFIQNLNGLNGLLFLSSYMNVSIPIIFVIWCLWCYFLNSKELAIPKITEVPSIKASSNLVYLSFWIFLGIVIGINIYIYSVAISLVLKYSTLSDGFTLNWSMFSYIYENLKIDVPYLEYYIFVHLLGALFTIFYMVPICQSISGFSSEVKKLITNFYKCDFPDVKIKTENGEIKGQLKDILNKSMVTLSEDSTLKMIQWDKIETMEIYSRNETSISE